MDNSLGTIVQVVVDNIVSIVGVIMGFVFAYSLFIIKERRRITKLEYEKVSSLSLVSMDERMRDRIKITCDGKPTNNIFSFRFRIRNRGKTPARRIPIVVEFNDKNVQILDIKGTFEPTNKVRSIELSLDDTKKNRATFVITPGLEKDEEVMFDVFTKDNETGEVGSFVIKLGEETLGVQWRHAKKKEVMTPVLLMRMVVIALVALFASLIVSAVIVVNVPAVEEWTGCAGLPIIVAAIVSTYLATKWK